MDNAYRERRLLVMQPTTFCNIDCKYCYLTDRNATLKMKPEIFRRTLENLASSGMLDRDVTVCWHAGEPLVVPLSFYETVFEISKEFSRPGAVISHNIQTNAMLVTERHASLFAEEQVSIGASIDGPDFIHDRNRVTRKGKGTHARAMQGVQKLQDRGVHINVIAVLTSFALDYPDEMYRFFKESGLKHVGFNVDEVEGTNLNSSMADSGADLRFRKFFRRFLELNRDRSLLVREYNGFVNNLMHCDSPTQNSQVTPFDIISVDVRGNYSTFSPELLGLKSQHYGDFILGNVGEGLIKDCVTTPKFRQMFGDIEAGVNACRESCRYFAVCGGGAPSNKYFENGSFSGTETDYCRLTKQVLTEIMLDHIDAEAQVCV